jgi:Zn-dependent protease
MPCWWVEQLIRDGQHVTLVSWIFWVIFSITLHELAHGWAAIYKGDRTPIESGHMTLNPVVHMGIPSLIMLALCGIAWGQMPVNPYRMRGKRADVFVSAAGPAMNVLLAALCIAAGALWLRFGLDANASLDGGTLETPWQVNVLLFLWLGAKLNIVLAILNLMPVPPLDGSRILAGYSPKMAQVYSHPNAPVIGMFVLLAVFFLSPMGDLISMWAGDGVLWVMAWLAGG